MKTNEAVRNVMKDKDIGVNQMARMLGKSSRLVSERLSQENISVLKLQEMLRLLDYKIVIVPQKTRLSDGEYEIE